MNTDHQDLMELLLKLDVQVHRQMFIKCAGKSIGHHNGRLPNSHLGQGRVIAILMQHPEISQRELTAALGMSKQALGELLNKLELSGCISRSPSERDRRMMIVRLTEAGRAAAEKMKELEPESEDFFSCLTPEEQNNLRIYLTKLLEHSKAACEKQKCAVHRQRIEKGDFV